MKWLKAFVLNSLLLLLLPFAMAEITIQVPEKETYNLGDKIAASVSLLESQSYDGFLKVAINCEGYVLQYYTTPLSLEATFRTQVQVPELTLFTSMKGLCSINAEFEDINGDKISKASSESFFVTDELNISTSSIIRSLPYEKITLKGTVGKMDGENLKEGSLKISFLNKDYGTNVDFGDFEYNLSVEDLDIGNYPIVIAVGDKYKNYADTLVQLIVLPIATRVENRLESEKVRPGSLLKAKIILYDHKGRVMNGTLNVELIDPNGKKLLKKYVSSLDSVNYELTSDALPGLYKIISKIEDINEETGFEVETVKQLSMHYENEAVIVENIGNVDYDDETTIMLESDNKKYLINKKIELKPGETLSIELSKEVPYGFYDINLPQTQEIMQQSQEENATEPQEEANVIKAVEISDKRPVYKKIGSGLGIVTGSVVRAGGYIASRPLLASVILIVIVLLIVGYYGRGFLMDRIKGRKSRDTSQLFKDFKYKEEKEEK